MTAIKTRKPWRVYAQEDDHKLRPSYIKMLRELGPDYAPRGLRIRLLNDPSGLFPSGGWFSTKNFAATARRGNWPEGCTFDYFDHDRELIHRCVVHGGKIRDVDTGQELRITATNLKMYWRNPREDKMITPNDVTVKELLRKYVQEEISLRELVRARRAMKSPGMKKGFKYKTVQCEICGKELSENWYIRHVKAEHAAAEERL